MQLSTKISRSWSRAKKYLLKPGISNSTSLNTYYYGQEINHHIPFAGSCIQMSTSLKRSSLDIEGIDGGIGASPRVFCSNDNFAPFSALTIYGMPEDSLACEPFGCIVKGNILELEPSNILMRRCSYSKQWFQRCGHVQPLATLSWCTLHGSGSKHTIGAFMLVKASYAIDWIL